MITTKKASAKKPVVKQTNMKISGYVMMSDPKDSAKISDLKHRLDITKVDLANAEREVKQLRNQVYKLRGFEWMRKEASVLMRELDLLGKCTIRELVYDWPGSKSQLAKFAKANREEK